jgi:hypothetical protein
MHDALSVAQWAPCAVNDLIIKAGYSRPAFRGQSNFATGNRWASKPWPIALNPARRQAIGSADLEQ